MYVKFDHATLILLCRNYAYIMYDISKYVCYSAKQGTIALLQNVKMVSTYIHTVGDIKNLTFRSAKISYYEYRSMRTVT